MKTYKEFITEVDLFTSKNKKEGNDHILVPDVISRKKIDMKYYHVDNDHISTHPKTGHKIFKSKKISGTAYHSYHAHDPKVPGKIDISLFGTEKKHKNGTITHKIDTLASRDGSKLKAHDFYHHLITHHNMILHTHAQTTGGKKVWDKLAQKKDINIHGHKRGQPVNVSNKHEDDESDIYQKVGHHGDHNDEDNKAAGISLIAHKKIRK